MAERITLEGFDPPKNRRHGPDGDLVDVQGWLHAPVDWTGGPGSSAHGASATAGPASASASAVANNPRRHILMTNVPADLDFLRSELESLIAEFEPDATSDLEDAQ